MRRLALVTLITLTLGACSDDPPATPDTPGGTEQITGNERIGWSQQAASAADLAGLRYNIYVDNTRTELQGVSCANVAASDGYACSARLPQLTQGRHVLELTAFVVDTGAESARSASLTVVVGQGSLGSSPGGDAGSVHTVVTADGYRLIAAAIAAGFDDPTDLAVARDGRIFVAERAGRVQIVKGNRLQPVPALVLDDVDATSGRGLLGLALDPAFEKTGHLFAVYTAESGFRIARYRAVGDALAERAILVDGIESALSDAAATLRFGPDGKLYAAFDDAGDPRRPGDLGSFNGKVLRLNPDGTTPPDQAGGTPVHALHLNQPRGMDWDARSTLWIAEAVRLQGVAVSAPQARAAAMVNYNLPPGFGAGAMLYYRGALMPPLAGNLLVASEEGRAILRLTLDPGDRSRIAGTEYLLQGAIGGIRTIAAAPDGIVYFSTASELFMLAPDPAGDRTPARQ
jgi:glucose/arabinose dehydrogenase